MCERCRTIAMLSGLNKGNTGRRSKPNYTGSRIRTKGSGFSNKQAITSYSWYSWYVSAMLSIETFDSPNYGTTFDLTYTIHACRFVLTFLCAALISNWTRTKIIFPYIHRHDPFHLFRRISEWNVRKTWSKSWKFLITTLNLLKISKQTRNTESDLR